MRNLPAKQRPAVSTPIESRRAAARAWLKKMLQQGERTRSTPAATPEAKPPGK
jgi:hypothetical protein